MTFAPPLTAAATPAPEAATTVASRVATNVVLPHATRPGPMPVPVRPPEPISPPLEMPVANPIRRPFDRLVPGDFGADSSTPSADEFIEALTNASGADPKLALSATDLGAPSPASTPVSSPVFATSSASPSRPGGRALPFPTTAALPIPAPERVSNPSTSSTNSSVTPSTNSALHSATNPATGPVPLAAPTWRMVLGSATQLAAAALATGDGRTLLFRLHMAGTGAACTILVLELLDLPGWNYVGGVIGAIVSVALATSGSNRPPAPTTSPAVGGASRPDVSVASIDQTTAAATTASTPASDRA